MTVSMTKFESFYTARAGRYGVVERARAAGRESRLAIPFLRSKEALESRG